jgi:hypothetical protein
MKTADEAADIIKKAISDKQQINKWINNNNK